MLELFDWLAPTQGEFWYIQSHTGVGLLPAELPALDWYARAEADGDRGPWRSFPLWNVQHASLATSQFLDAAGLAIQRLNRLEQRGVAVRWVLGHQDLVTSRQFQENCLLWEQEGRVSFHAPNRNQRLYQLTGATWDSLQELVYLGGARAPGVALLEPPTLINQTTPLLTLIETLLMRRFWVILKLPHPPEREKHTHETAYSMFADGVARLQVPGTRYLLEGEQRGLKPKAPSELWLLSPGEELRLLQKRISDRLQLLLGQALGLASQGGKISGFEEHPMASSEDALRTFFSQFPVHLMPHLVVDRAREGDLAEVIHLWEQLMDEHATFDEHFQRRPLARLYLRHSFNSQQSQPDYLLLVARWKRKPIGFLSAQILRAPLFQESRIGQVIDVYILPEWRSQNIGTQMVELVTHWFKAMKITQVDLNVAVRNERGCAFWEEQGFQPYLRVVSKEI